ncbi:DUF6364 family protein [Mucilaginibacter sp. KACC 22063]|uniref:DUF6364 family protein n=1 Tax=Mucilaginibacter sp. KACC 22063 TaxID=3025666 RepID=UPI002366BDA4|nr:DUF6364 family protein [Mucilaginibacter sp. KACC 22063]WDF54922.1 DUF6364 family protein [Mucilaginibacter sp. KACC 22063]
MATSKLTLSIETDTIEQAKQYAKKQHTSLSKLIQGYLQSVARDNKKGTDPLLNKIKEAEISDTVKSLTGIIKVPDNFDTDSAKDQYMKEKYGL